MPPYQRQKGEKHKHDRREGNNCEREKKNKDEEERIAERFGAKY